MRISVANAMHPSAKTNASADPARMSVTQRRAFAIRRDHTPRDIESPRIHGKHITGAADGLDQMWGQSPYVGIELAFKRALVNQDFAQRPAVLNAWLEAGFPL